MKTGLLCACALAIAALPGSFAQNQAAFLQKQLAFAKNVNLEDDDPQNFGVNANGKTCMGGVWSKIKLTAKCETLLGYLVVDNTELTTLDALKNIKYIKPWKNMAGPKGASVYIVNNHKLTDISALKLMAAPGDVIIEGNNMLVDANLNAKKINGNVYFQKNAKLQGVRVNAEEILGNVNVANNNELEAIELAVKQVKGALKVKNNAKLVKLQVGQVKIANNKVNAVPFKLGAGTDGSSLIISGNDKLANLDGLRMLQGILGGAIEISKNAALANVDGLKNVQGLGKNKFHVSLAVSGNHNLNSLMGFNSLNGKVPGSIEIDSNPSLVALAGFQAITEIGANVKGNALVVESNKILVKFLGFSNLAKANGALVVKKNPSLQLISGLRNLRALSGVNKNKDSLEIMYNPKLVKADLVKLVSLSGGVVIKNNPALSNLLEFAKGMQRIGGEVVVQNVKCFGNKEVNLLKIASKEKYFANIKANANNCLGSANVGSGRGEICGGSAGGSWGTWNIGGSTGLYLDVDTSKCKFASKMNGTPNYVTSIVGNSAHWQVTGVNSVYKATPTGFRIHVWHPVMRGKFMQFFAAKYKWKINWLADTGKNSGITAAGQTGWKKVPNTQNVLYVDVSTAASEFKTTPRYISAIHGGAAHWKVTGSHSIYHPTKNGFRVYVVYPTAITAQFAETNKWTIAYVGSEDSRTSGVNNAADWKTYTDADGKKALKVTVDTSKGGYRTMPVYVTSLTGESQHWLVTGAGAVYAGTNKRFKVYLANANTPAFAKDYGWQVNYVAFAGKSDCSVTSWSGWQKCTASCGSGTATRTRDIITYAYYGGKCGSLKDVKKCNTNACPVDCVVAAWSKYGKCSRSCAAGGLETRTRAVISVENHGGKKCPMLSQARTCDLGPCPVHCSVTPWGAYTTCTKTCGSGTQTSRRVITKHAAHGGFVCPNLWRTQSCNLNACPIDCVQSGWNVLSTCTQTCGTGTQFRSRSTITKVQHGGKKCGMNKQFVTCAHGACPIHCKTSDWSLYSKCTKTCGMGTKFRNRSVVTKAQYGGVICPKLADTVGCVNDIASCPIDCIISNWKTSTCTKTCGTGMKVLTRSIIVPSDHGGKLCPSEVSRTLNCNTNLCPVDCAWTWGAWSTCSKTCARGEEIRRVIIATQPAHGGVGCPVVQKQDRPCDAGPCPVHCLVSGYGSWTRCSKTCGIGSKSRARAIIRSDKYGGVKCPKLVDVEACSPLPCPIDCVVAAWTQWTTCSRTCKSGLLIGEQWRSRAVLRKAVFGGRVCPIVRTKRTCNTQHCPVDCVHSDWTPFSACSKTCGEGAFRKRTRTIKSNPRYGGKACAKVIDFQLNTCFLGKCPIHCSVSTWTPYTKCTKTCGTGYQTRTRKVVVADKHGGIACPALLNREKCNPDSCPIDCVVSSWSPLSICTKTCGAGKQSRTRDITVKARFGGKICPRVIKTNLCNIKPCPIDCVVGIWKRATRCTKTCGTGSYRSERPIKTQVRFGGVKCPATVMTTTCGTNKCPIHCKTTNWGDWSKCSVSCGGGRRSHTRSVLVANKHGGIVCPNLSGAESCKPIKCPIDCKMTKWSKWAPFSGGGNNLKRRRTIVSYPVHGGKACGHVIEEKQDLGSKCRAAIVYGSWSQCNKKCGTGYRYRHWERIHCSATSALRFHFHMRQGEHCNTSDCNDPKDNALVPIFIPPITAVQRVNGNVAPMA